MMKSDDGDAVAADDESVREERKRKNKQTILSPGRSRRSGRIRRRQPSPSRPGPPPCPDQDQNRSRPGSILI